MPRGARSNRVVPLPPNWESQTRPRILQRDNHTCQWPISTDGTICGLYAYRVDHKDPAHRGGGDDDDNLWALCDGHTRLKDAREGGLAAAARQARRRRPPEPHPGLIG